jgi:hypothetical protein
MTPAAGSGPPRQLTAEPGRSHAPEQAEVAGKTRPWGPERTASSDLTMVPRWARLASSRPVRAKLTIGKQDHPAERAGACAS